MSARRACGCTLTTRLCTCVCRECYPQHATYREIPLCAICEKVEQHANHPASHAFVPGRRVA